ncbi:hypothetical protein Tco_0481542 [Tanacetum coccineum]
MMEAMPKLVDECIKKILQVPLHVAQGLILEREKSQADVEKMIADAIQKDERIFIQRFLRNLMMLLLTKFLRRPSVVRPRDQDDPHDDTHSEGKNSAKRPKTSEHGIIKLRGSSSGLVYESEPDDDVILNEKVSQELVDEMSQTVNEAKLRKMVDEMLRQRCTSGDEHQYHIDQMHNFLKSDIMWESRKEILVSPVQPKPTPVINSEGHLGELGHDVHVFLSQEDCAQEEPMEGIVLSLCGESYQQQVNLTTTTITFPDIEKYKVFFIISKPVYGIIYKNIKKEKRVMRHQEVYKFCDATLKRVLEGLKSYNNNVKYGYVTHSLSKEDVEYLQLFVEEIEEQLKYRDQMRRWEMYMKRRPLGLRREHPE